MNYYLLIVILIAVVGLVVANRLYLRKWQQRESLAAKPDFLSPEEWQRFWAETVSETKIHFKWAEIAVVEWRWVEERHVELYPYQAKREGWTLGAAPQPVVNPDEELQKGIMLGFNSREMIVAERVFTPAGKKEVISVPDGDIWIRMTFSGPMRGLESIERFKMRGGQTLFREYYGIEGLLRETYHYEADQLCEIRQRTAERVGNGIGPITAEKNWNVICCEKGAFHLQPQKSDSDGEKHPE